MNLSDFKKMKADLEKQIAKNGEKVLAEEFKAFFEKFPEIAAVRWVQYTPHFNDGDECTFSRHDFSVSLDFVENLKKDSEYDDDNFIDPYEAKKGSIAKAALDHLSDAFDSDTDDLFQHTFDDGYQITATVDGFDVVEYDHD